MLTVHRFTFNPIQENTYIVYNEKRDCCIIDPGCYFASEETALHDFIRGHALQPKYLLNTHAHFDHIFGNRFVHKHFGLVPYLHPLDLQIFTDASASAAAWQIPFDNYDGTPLPVAEGDSFRIGDDVLEVLFTPGHSPGSVSFYSADHRFIVSGDVLFERGIGRTDLSGGDHAVLETTIKTKLYTLPPDVIVYPGHGDTTTIGDELKGNPFVRMI